MEVYKLKLRKSDLDCIPVELRRTFVEQLIVVDELSALAMAEAFSWPPGLPADTELRESQVAHRFFFTRLLAAKLFQAWPVLGTWKKDGLPIAELAREARNDFCEFNRILGAHSEIFAMVRNELTFHYDSDTFAESFKGVSPDEELKMWITPRRNYSRNGAALVVCATAIANKLDPNRKREAFLSFNAIVRTASQILIRLLSHWIAATVAKYGLLKGAETVQIPEVAGPFLPAIYDLEEIAGNPQRQAPAGPDSKAE